MQVRGQLADFLTRSVAILLARSLGAVPTVRITNLRSSRKAFIWLIPGTKKAALPSPGTSSSDLSLIQRWRPLQLRTFRPTSFRNSGTLRLSAEG